jgi:membrane-associated phospholipid phosphatase
MTTLDPRPRRSTRQTALVALAWLAAVALAHALDRWTWSWITIGKSVESRDWWQFLRAFGYLGTWIILALGIDLARTAIAPRPANRPGLAALLAALLAGGLAEALKFVFGRERPTATGDYLWHGFFAPLSTGENRGIPSSHAAVAFAAALTLAAAFPRATPVLLLMAIGCGISRLLPGAHFLSDVVLGAALGALAAALLRPLATGVPRDRRAA